MVATSDASFTSDNPVDAKNTTGDNTGIVSASKDAYSSSDYKNLRTALQHDGEAIKDGEAVLGKGAVIFNDSQGRMDSVYASDGSSVKYNYVNSDSNSVSKVTLSDGKGNNQVISRVENDGVWPFNNGVKYVVSTNGGDPKDMNVDQPVRDIQIDPKTGQWTEVQQNVNIGNALVSMSTTAAVAPLLPILALTACGDTSTPTPPDGKTQTPQDAKKPTQPDGKVDCGGIKLGFGSPVDPAKQKVLDDIDNDPAMASADGNAKNIAKLQTEAAVKAAAAKYLEDKAKGKQVGDPSNPATMQKYVSDPTLAAVVQFPDKPTVVAQKFKADDAALFAAYLAHPEDIGCDVLQKLAPDVPHT